MKPRGRVALLLVALLLSACNGGTVDLHALKNDSKSIDSLACEGALLADELGQGESTGPFTSVHAGELATRLVLGRKGRLEHFGIGAQASASSTRVRDVDIVPWKDVVRFEENRIVVRDSAIDG